MIRIAPLLTLAALTLILTACGPYEMKGKVIEGASPMVLVVSDNDERLQAAGISGATIEVTMDPRDANRKSLGRDVSGGDGKFAVPITEFGAGALEYRVGILARAKGHAFAYEEMLMPGLGKRLLIILPRGVDTYQRPEDPLGESRKFLPPPAFP